MFRHGMGDKSCCKVLMAWLKGGEPWSLGCGECRGGMALQTLEKSAYE